MTEVVAEIVPRFIGAAFSGEFRHDTHVRVSASEAVRATAHQLPVGRVRTAWQQLTDRLGGGAT